MGKISNANFPLADDGSTYHVGTKFGQVANRIITVGEVGRAKQIASNFDQLASFSHTSKRQFTTITGTFKGVPVSVVAIGMGTSMMDFFIREVRAVTKGPLAIIRFGSCGSIGEAKLGDVVVASEGSIAIQRNYDHFCKNYENANEYIIDNFSRPYILSKRCPADRELSDLVIENLKKNIGEDRVKSGLNCTADTFYAAQGRIDSNFIDDNATLIEDIKILNPRAQTLEMETYMLLHMAQCSRSVVNKPAVDIPSIVSETQLEATENKPESENEIKIETEPEIDIEQSIRSTGCAMVFAERFSNGFISPEVVAKTEVDGGLAVLEAITTYKFEVEPAPPVVLQSHEEVVPFEIKKDSRTIAICVDESDYAKSAFEWALTNFIRPDDNVVILNARMHKGKNGESQNDKELSHDLIRSYASNLLKKNINCSGLALVGEPREVLVSKVNELKATTVIAGVKGTSAVKHVLVGTTADYLTRHCRFK
ncbi:hypothetical protein HK099_001807 [Clydaea vesicula]|uniref:Nucleoside phosphorylase domain-containing protein n=1 Tax=Clydaea vesicula TaxID=447962 RepID=A0AAD5XVT9_9FUNG|nr:hypothetical protein HK099_001807 [Clydaea vesicula]